jgi:HK97 family phage prohead protease
MTIKGVDQMTAELTQAAPGGDGGHQIRAPHVGLTFPLDDLMAMEPRAAARPMLPPLETRDASFDRRGAVAVIRIEGPLMQRGGWWWDGYEAIQERFAEALKDASVGAIVLRINSCGGVVAGCFEAVRAMRRAKVAAGKPVIAFADEAAYSAAYAVATVADEIYLPEPGGVGSVGVIGCLFDETEALKSFGLKVVVVTSGKLKADGHPDVPLSDDVVRRYQARIDDLGDQFATLVAEARGRTSRYVLGLEAACLYGREAASKGLADGVRSFDDVLAMAEERAAKASGGLVQRAASGVIQSPRAAAPAAGRTHHAHRFDRFIRALAAGAAHGHDIDPDLASALSGAFTRDAGGAPAVSRPDGLRVRAVNLRAVREAEREADWVASTEGEAADGAILRQDWRLERFLKNPVVLFAHDICSLPIGRAENVRIEGGQLLLTVKFASARANPIAELCWQSVREDMLRGGSVGFLPGRIEREDVGGVMRTVLHENELYEFSLVPVPSDEDSLVERMERSIAGWGGAVRAVGASADVREPPSEANQPAAASGQEATMDLEKMKEALAAKERELADEKANNETLRVAAAKSLREADEARAAAAKATEDLGAEKAKVAAEKERADGLQKEICKRDLEPMVGKQISPEERDELIEIAIENPKRYERMVASAKGRQVQTGLTDRVELGGAGLPEVAGEQGQAGLISIFNRHVETGSQLRVSEFVAANADPAAGPAIQPASDGLASLLQRHAGAA